MSWPISRSERTLIKALLKVARTALVEVHVLVKSRTAERDPAQQDSLEEAIRLIDELVP
jgi:hypothetical protein